MNTLSKAVFGPNGPNGIGNASGPWGGGSIGFDSFDNTPHAGQGVKEKRVPGDPAKQRGPSAEVNPTVTKLTNVQNPQFK